MADSYAKQLQDCKAEKASLLEDVERLAPVQDELTKARMQVANLSNRIVEIEGTQNANRIRNLLDQVELLTQQNNMLNQRINNLVRENRDARQLVADIADLINGKECILPQIRERLARG